MSRTKIKHWHHILDFNLLTPFIVCKNVKGEILKNKNKGTLLNHLVEGQSVYIRVEYYKDMKTNLVEIPRFGWVVKSILNNVATIAYQRKNIMMNMTLMIDTKYLSKEINGPG